MRNFNNQIARARALCARVELLWVAAMNETCATTLSKQAKLALSRWRPLFMCNWSRAVFIHFKVEPRYLQPQVPFELDLYRDQAYVSLVAFTMHEFRPRWGAALLGSAGAQLSRCEFLNVRTYVDHQGTPGIYFLAEWLPHHLSVLLGPALFGLPYRRARLSYVHTPELGVIHGKVRPAGSTGQLSYEAQLRCGVGYSRSAWGSLTQFLLERYVAFTWWHGLKRLFRVWHPPWAQTEIDVQLNNSTALRSTGTWWPEAALCSGHYSPGVRDVWISPPQMA